MSEFVITPSFVKVTAALGDAEVGRLFRAMCEYALSGDEPELRGNERVLFPAAKMMIDANRTEATREKEQERTKEKEKERARSNNKNKYSPDFEEFWSTYPRKVDKEKAYNSWKRINPSDELLKSIIKSVEEWKQCSQWEDERYIPHPTVWLNNRRWEAHPPTKKRKNILGHYANERDCIRQEDVEAMMVDLNKYAE